MWFDVRQVLGLFTKEISMNQYSIPKQALNALFRYMLVLGVCANCQSAPFAATNNDIPSHCKESEIVFLNARMNRVETNNAEKILSLCGNKEAEPLETIIYRFGSVDKVEIELVASAKSKAGIVRQSDKASHTGLISIYFYKGQYAYEVSEGLGMTTGISLNVFYQKKKIVGYESYEYDSELPSINFDQAISPIFKRVRPFQPW